MESNENVDRNLSAQADTDELFNDLPVYRIASKSKRFANYLIDYACCVVFGLIIGFTIAVICISLGWDISWIEEESNKLVELILGTIITLGYYCFFEGVLGTTVGKLVTRTIIVTEDGYKPEFKEILQRSLWRIVPFEAFTFLGNNGVGWHDEKTGTRVVDKSSYIAPQQ